MTWRKHAVVAMSALALAAIPWTDIRGGQEPQQPSAQGQEPDAVEPTPQTLLSFSGNAARAKRARTQTTPSTIGETATWVNIPSATLTYTVPAGTFDTFNVAFSAEGRLFNGGSDDWVRIRVRDIVGSVTSFLQPYDGDQAFFSANAYATHAGNWIRRAGPGTHTLQVQVWIFDGFPSEVLSARVDDWTFELVVYD
jgi:hypothetical protein